jgi:RNA polymerase sigma-70 factor (ECF subfamily)
MAPTINQEFDLTRLRMGDRAEFERLFKTFYPSLVQFSLRFTGSKAASEEIVQEVFTDFWDYRAKLEPKGSLCSYLYTLTQNKTLNVLKHEKIMIKYNQMWSFENHAPEPVPDVAFASDQHAVRLQQALDKAIQLLPESCKTVYTLHRFDGFTYPEIAQITGTSVKNVEYLLTKALKQLREALILYKTL